VNHSRVPHQKSNKDGDLSEEYIEKWAGRVCRYNEISSQEIRTIVFSVKYKKSLRVKPKARPNSQYDVMEQMLLGPKVKVRIIPTGNSAGHHSVFFAP
jgi:hypothetical protein